MYVRTERRSRGVLPNRSVGTLDHRCAKSGAPVCAVAYVDRDVFATGGFDRTLRVWHAPSAKATQWAHFNDAITSVCCAQRGDGPFLLTSHLSDGATAHTHTLVFSVVFPKWREESSLGRVCVKRAVSRSLSLSLAG